MKFSEEIIDEVNVLSCFDLGSLQSGIKVHSTANDKEIAATKRLFDKGLVSQVDGGYLTDSGREAAEHLLHLSGLLGTTETSA